MTTDRRALLTGMCQFCNHWMGCDKPLDHLGHCAALDKDTSRDFVCAHYVRAEKEPPSDEKVQAKDDSKNC